MTGPRPTLFLPWPFADSTIGETETVVWPQRSVHDNLEGKMETLSIRRLSASWGPWLVVAALLANACGGGGGSTTNTASAPGITATEITIGSHQPLTGPAAPGYSEISKASDA